MFHSTKGILKVSIIGTLLGFVSLVPPWWSLIVLVENNMVASYNMFFWGVLVRGFQRATLSFEWWSYLTFAIVLISSLIGTGGYMLTRRGHIDGEKLLGLQGIFAFSGCLFYLGGLILTLTAYNNPSTPSPITQHWWMIESPQILIAVLGVFKVSHVPSWQLTVFEFLSIGFWLAVISGAFSLISFYKLRNLKAEQ